MLAYTPISEETRLRNRLDYILGLVGKPGHCPGCKKPVRWLRHWRTDAVIPYSLDGSDHDCEAPPDIE